MQVAVSAVLDLPATHRRRAARPGRTAAPGVEGVLDTANDLAASSFVSLEAAPAAFEDVLPRERSETLNRALNLTIAVLAVQHGGNGWLEGQELPKLLPASSGPPSNRQVVASALSSTVAERPSTVHSACSGAVAAEIGASRKPASVYASVARPDPGNGRRYCCGRPTKIRSTATPLSRSSADK